MTYKPLQIGELQIPIPIVQGGMGIGVSGAGLASAVANCGGIGILSAAQIGYQEPDFKTNHLAANLRALRQEIQKARQLTTGVIGVNIMVAMEQYIDLCKVAVEEKVDLIVSGAGLPIDLPAYVQGSATKIVPIVSSLRSCQLILKAWQRRYARIPDAIVIEGPQAGGHLGFQKSDLINQTVESVEQLTKKIADYLQGLKLDRPIPLIAGGGVSTPDKVCSLFQAGADAVQVATRLVATKECDASLAFKQRYVTATNQEIVLLDSPVGLPGRALDNSMLERVRQGQRIPFNKCYHCVSKCNPATTPFCITQALIAAVEGDIDSGLVFVGGDIEQVTEITTVKQVIAQLMS